MSTRDDSVLHGILHQLENGEASEGDLRDIAFCARSLREHLGLPAKEFACSSCGRPSDLVAEGTADSGEIYVCPRCGRREYADGESADD